MSIDVQWISTRHTWRILQRNPLKTQLFNNNFYTDISGLNLESDASKRPKNFFFFQAASTNLVSVIDLLDLIGLASPGPLFLG